MGYNILDDNPERWVDKVQVLVRLDPFRSDVAQNEFLNFYDIIYILKISAQRSIPFMSTKSSQSPFEAT